MHSITKLFLATIFAATSLFAVAPHYKLNIDFQKVNEPFLATAYQGADTYYDVYLYENKVAFTNSSITNMVFAYQPFANSTALITGTQISFVSNCAVIFFPATNMYWPVKMGRAQISLMDGGTRYDFRDGYMSVQKSLLHLNPPAYPAYSLLNWMSNSLPIGSGLAWSNGKLIADSTLSDNLYWTNYPAMIEGATNNLAPDDLAWTNKLDASATNQLAPRSWVAGFSSAPATWNSDFQTVDVALPEGVTGQMFQENHVYGKNDTGTVISNGAVCYIANASGFNCGFEPANATNGFLTSLRTIGIATHDIGIGASGKVTTFGNVNDINTLHLIEGQPVYLDTVSGRTTTNSATYPNANVHLGVCLRSHANAGRIYVTVQSIPHAQNIGAATTVHSQPLSTITNAGNLAYSNSLTYTDVGGASAAQGALADTTATNTLDLEGTRAMTGDSVTLARDVKSRDATSVSAHGVAMGYLTVAGGFGVAMGYNNVAAEGGVAMGEDSTAGNYGVVIGSYSTAGSYGAAFGSSSAAGNYGFTAGTCGKGAFGSFVFSDRSGEFPYLFDRTAYTNWFSVRASGGTYFETPDLSVTGTVTATSFNGSGSTLTSLDTNPSLTNPVAKALSAISTNGGTVSGSIYSTIDHTTMSPSDNELATAGWVRDLFPVTATYYSASNDNTVVTGLGFTCRTLSESIPPLSSGVFTTGLTNAGYLASIATTQKVNATGTAVINAYISAIGANPSPSLTLHPEIYATGDGTNLYGDWEAQNQVITLGGTTNLYTFVIPIGSITNSYVVRRWKIGAANNITSIRFHNGTNGVDTASSMGLTVSATPVDEYVLTAAKIGVANGLTNSGATINGMPITNGASLTISGGGVSAPSTWDIDLTWGDLAQETTNDSVGLVSGQLSRQSIYNASNTVRYASFCTALTNVTTATASTAFTVPLGYGGTGAVFYVKQSQATNYPIIFRLNDGNNTLSVTGQVTATDTETTIPFEWPVWATNAGSVVGIQAVISGASTNLNNVRYWGVNRKVRLQK